MLDRDLSVVDTATNTVTQYISGIANRAAAWLTNAPEALRHEMANPIVAAWAKRDASAALAWAAKNLNGITLDAAVGTVIWSKGEDNIPFAVNLVEQLEPSTTKTTQQWP